MKERDGQLKQDPLESKKLNMPLKIHIRNSHYTEVKMLQEERKMLKKKVEKWEEKVDEMEKAKSEMANIKKALEELANIKKALEEEVASHEQETAEMRHKHSSELASLNNQMDSLKKSKAQAEKGKSTLEAELADLTNELKSVSSNKQEAERKRKQLESHAGWLEIFKYHLHFLFTFDYLR